MPPSPPISARQLRAANRSGGLAPASEVSKPKSTSRKCLQSNADNADESVSKRSRKAAHDTDDTTNNTAIAVEESLDRQKGGKEGKKAKKTGGKGKKTYLSCFYFYFLF